MKLIIEITHIEHDLPDSELDKLNEARLEIAEVILEYCKLGIKPSIGEEVCAKEHDEVVEITDIAYCDWKIMYQCKLV